MSATKNWLHDYTETVDKTWAALESAIEHTTELNDLVWTPEGEIKMHANRVDVGLLLDKVEELCKVMAEFEAAKAPSRLAPLLPGELRCAV